MLQKKLETLSRKTNALLDELTKTNPHVLTYKPSPEKWSILEIIEHLVISEELLFQKVMHDTRPVKPRQTLRHRILYQIVMFLLRSAIPVKVPSKRLLPAGGQALENLGERWKKNQSELRAWLKKESGRALDSEMLAWHPVAGPMTLAQALDMLDAHFIRHRSQIQKILAVA